MSAKERDSKFQFSKSTESLVVEKNLLGGNPPAIGFATLRLLKVSMLLEQAHINKGNHI